jgi:hypothetical protein
MLVTYAGCLRQDERRMAVEKWRNICHNFKIQTTVVPATEFMQQNYNPLKSWLGKFEFYSQNYLSLRMSHKWPVLLDPHNLGIYYLSFIYYFSAIIKLKSLKVVLCKNLYFSL